MDEPDVEKGLLGALLVHDQARPRAFGQIEAEDFRSARHRTIYAAIRRRHDSGEPCDVVTVTDALQARGELQRCGGRGYLAELVEVAEPVARVVYVVRQVRERGRVEAAKTSLKRLNARVDTFVPGTGHLDELVCLVDSVRDNLRIGRQTEAWSAAAAAQAALEEIVRTREHGSPAIKTGLEALDRKTGGLRQGEVTVVGARPGQGKTALVLQFVLNAARARWPHIGGPARVVLVSLEMNVTTLMHRLFSAISGVSGRDLREGTVDDSDMALIQSATADVSALPIMVWDRPATIELIDSLVRGLQSRPGVDLLVIDYLTLIQMDSRAARYLEIGKVTRQLKVLAQELKIPVVLVSQLNREGDEKPRLSHLRESGAIEQDADIVLLMQSLGHEHDIDEFFRGRPVDVRLDVAKNRNGITGVVDLKFDRERMRFFEVEGGGGRG